MGEYYDLYLKIDVLLLCDVFQRFIKTCFEYYSLDPSHYFSCPGLSWDAMLKMTGINLELISDIDMHLFMEKGMVFHIFHIGEVVFHIFQKDTVKLIKINALSIRMQIIYMAVQ